MNSLNDTVLFRDKYDVKQGLEQENSKYDVKQGLEQENSESKQQY